MLFSLFLLLLLYACGGSDESNTVNPAANTPLNDPVNDLEIVEISSQSSTGASYINSYATLCSMLPCNEYGNGNNYLLGDTRYVCLQEGNTNQWSWQMLFSSLDELELLQPCNETLYRRKAILDDVKSTYKCMPDVFGTWKWQRSFYMVEDLAVQPCDESNDGEIVLLYDIYNRCMADASNLNWNWTLFLTSYNETLQTYPCSDSRVYNRIAYFVAEDAYSICSADASGLWNWSELIKKENSEIVELESSSSMQYIPNSSASVVKSSSSVANKKGTFVDSQDGQSYRFVTIGKQTWMAENMNFNDKRTLHIFNVCYDEVESNCSIYGRLYSSDFLMCPDGWHMPDTTEWNRLFAAVGGMSIAGKMLKSKSGWNGSDAFGFDALPGGYMHYDIWGRKYLDEGDYAYFWSSTRNPEQYSNCSYGVKLSAEDEAEWVCVTEGNVYEDGNLAYSVRCIKD